MTDVSTHFKRFLEQKISVFYDTKKIDFRLILVYNQILRSIWFHEGHISITYTERLYTSYIYIKFYIRNLNVQLTQTTLDFCEFLANVPNFTAKLELILQIPFFGISRCF